MSFPEWAASAWALFSSRPLVPSLIEKMRAFQLPHFSVFWITTPLGFLMLGVILYLLITGRKTSTSDADEPERKEATVEGSVVFASCSDTWLHNMAEYEKNAIHKRVKVLECKIWNRLFDEIPIEIVFYVNLLNCSVYPIVLEQGASLGRIKHIRKPLLYQPAIEENEWECSHGNSQVSYSPATYRRRSRQNQERRARHVSV